MRSSRSRGISGWREERGHATRSVSRRTALGERSAAQIHAPLALAADRRLTLGALVSVAVFTTCGGAFGLEGLVGAAGPG